MRPARSPSLLPLILASVFIVSGCHDEEADNDSGGGGGGSSVDCSVFTSTLAIKDSMDQEVNTFIQGETITFEYSVKNESTRDRTLTEGGCSQVIFEVTDDSDTVRWGSEDEISCTADASQNRYDGLETLTFSAQWDQEDRDDQQVAIGTYTVTADDTSECSDELTTSDAFQIQ